MKYVALLVAASITGSAIGQTATWNNSNGNWSNSANWSPAPPADLATTVLFGGLTAYTASIDVQTACGPLNIANPLAVVSILNGTTPSTLAPNAPAHSLTGTIQVQGNDSQGALLRFDQSCLISRPAGGPGTIQLMGDRARLSAGVGATVTIGPNVQVRGSGRVDGEFINRGLFQSDVAARPMQFQNVTYTRENNGRLVGNNAAIYIFSSTLNNATIEMTGPALNLGYSSGGVTFNGTTSVTGPTFLYNDTLTVRGTWTNNGVMTMSGNNANSTLIVADQNTTIDGTGELSIFGRLKANPGVLLTIGPNQKLWGQDVRLIGNILSSGLLVPSGSNMFNSSSYFSIEPSSSLTLSSGGTTRFMLYGNASGYHGSIVGAGNLGLGGTLEIRLNPGYAPLFGKEFPIINMTGIVSGGFATESMPPIVDARRYFVRKLPSRWVVVTSCAADLASLGGDLNRDGALTADDVIAYLNAFLTGNFAVADICQLGGNPIPDGQITNDDLIQFLNLFFANCNNL